MNHELNFDCLFYYEADKTGINIPVTLWVGMASVDVISKLDTGASHCIFQRFYGEESGLEIENGSPLEFSTATGIFKTFGHDVLMNVSGFEFEMTVYFAKDYSFNRNVLGRTGFLNRIVLGLNDYAGKLYLSREIDTK